LKKERHSGTVTGVGGELTFDLQRRRWAGLKGLRPSPIDLQRVALVRARSSDELSQATSVEQLIIELGLNDEHLNELPLELHGYCGGLRVWQYPTQFSKYLVQLSRLGVRSYLEIGVRHGGSFVATVEYLKRFQPLEFAVGVDIVDCPSLLDYQAQDERVQFWCLDSKGAEFASRLEALGTVDLAFIDSHHDEAQCRTEVSRLAPHANLMAFHDILHVDYPAIGRIWRELTRSPSYRCFEYVDQYGGLGPFMGIGLAVKTSRWVEP
jgi:cephalosporin hydroxylase